MMEVGDQFSNSCSHANASVLKIANFLNVGISVACLTFLLPFLALLVLYKAYRTTLQRLLLYLTIATALNALIVTLNIELQFNNDFNSRFCYWLGFLFAWISNLVWLFSFAFTVYLSTTVYQRLKGEMLRCLGYCHKHPVLIEAICIFIMTLFPLSYLWVPHLHHNYGVQDDLCFMKKFDENCNYSKHYKHDYIIFEVVDISLHFMVSISFILLIVIILLNIIKVRRSKKKRVVSLRRTIFLIVAVGTTLCVRTMQVGWNLSYSYKKTRNEYEHMIDDPLYITTNLIIPLGFALYLYSPKKLGIKSLRKAAKKWSNYKRNNIRMRTKNNIGDDDGLVSVKCSVQQDTPSETQSYSPCYTNQFTDYKNATSSVSNYGAI